MGTRKDAGKGYTDKGHTSNYVDTHLGIYGKKCPKCGEPISKMHGRDRCFECGYKEERELKEHTDTETKQLYQIHVPKDRQ